MDQIRASPYSRVAQVRASTPPSGAPRLHSRASAQPSRASAQPSRASAMALNGAGIIAQLRQAAALLTANPNAAVQQALVHNICAQLNHARELTLADATQLVGEPGMNVFTQDQSALLARSALDRASALQRGGVMAGNGCQSFGNAAHTLCYHSRRDVDTLMASQPVITVTGAVLVGGTRFIKLKLDTPSEATTRAECAFLGLFIWPDRLPSATESYALVSQLKNHIKHQKAIHNFGASERLAVLPDDPNMLPGDLFASAYGSDPPVQTIHSRFWQMHSAIVMRTCN